MNKQFGPKRMLAFLTAVVVLTSCHEQLTDDLSEASETESVSSLVNQQKLIKTPSSHAGDNVHCSLQDKAGDLWFGTTGDGLYRYDGNTFTQFTSRSGLKSTTVWSILEDKRGLIWVGTSDGIYLYNGVVFMEIPIDLVSDTIAGRYDVWSIMQDKSDKLWFATGVGVYVYDGKSFTSFEVGSDEAPDCKFGVERILEDRSGNFWFGGRCTPGVYLYDGKTIEHLEPNGDDWAWPVVQDKRGDVWLSSWQGAYRYDGSSFRTFTENDGLSGRMVARLIEDKNGNLWFGGDGLSRYDGESFTRFTASDGLTNTSVWSILEDNAGNFWIGTRETSLYLFDGTRFIEFSE